ncbi:guanylate kinase [Actinomycetota bacterium]|nr:guanylate kinase [Actinomycetota bacterium]
MTKLNLTVLAGPTAVGKGTISRQLITKYPEVYLSISATTREPREGEVDGLHYHFISRPEFEKHINEDDFLEYAIVHGQNFYGTLRGPIADANEHGRPALLEIDLQGARQIKELGVDANFVFIDPPSFEELVTRLGMRGTEPPDERKRRLETAHIEMAAKDEFDFVIVNDEVDRAVDELATIMGLR